MIRRLLMVSLLVLATPIAPSYARQNPSSVADTSLNKEHPDLIRLRKQMLRHPELPPIDFWLAVGRCETGLGRHGANTWGRGSQWPRARTGGALGIHVDTWRGYGGRQFAIRPGKASMYAQIIVANRIGFLGFQTSQYLTLKDKMANKPFYRPAVGFNQGWGGKCRTQWLKNNS